MNGIVVEVAGSKVDLLTDNRHKRLTPEKALALAGMLICAAKRATNETMQERDALRTTVGRGA